LAVAHAHASGYGAWPAPGQAARQKRLAELGRGRAWASISPSSPAPCCRAWPAPVQAAAQPARRAGRGRARLAPGLPQSASTRRFAGMANPAAKPRSGSGSRCPTVREMSSRVQWRRKVSGRVVKPRCPRILADVAHP
jgi:hypothetical protein